MIAPTDHELIGRWKNAPAPLLPMLHAFHDRDGLLSPDTMQSVSKALKIPIADLYGTVTFYHHFARSEPGAPAPQGKAAPRVCTGPICCRRGAKEILEALQQRVPCFGSLPSESNPCQTDEELPEALTILEIVVQPA